MYLLTFLSLETNYTHNKIQCRRLEISCNTKITLPPKSAKYISTLPGQIEYIQAPCTTSTTYLFPGPTFSVPSRGTRSKFFPASSQINMPPFCIHKHFGPHHSANTVLFFVSEKVANAIQTFLEAFNGAHHSFTPYISVN